jgi:hypothetical protein
VYGYSGVDLMLFVVVTVLQEQNHGLCFPQELVASQFDHFKCQNGQIKFHQVQKIEINILFWSLAAFMFRRANLNLSNSFCK